MTPLEPPTVEDGPIWDIWLSSNILPSVSAADRLGLFLFLRDNPAPPERIQEHLGLERRPTEALLALLASFDLLVLREGLFHLTDLSRTYLCRDSGYYWGWMLGPNNPRTEQMVNVLKGADKTAHDRVGHNWEAGQLSAEQALNGARAMHSHSLPAALGMARHGDFTGVRRFLDVAGGSGCFSIALALMHPEIHCTVAELAPACDVAKQYIADFGVPDQVDTYVLNMFYDPWPKGYDAIFFSNVWHDWPLEACERLAKSAFEALPSGGRIYLHEMLLADGKDGPRRAALFSMMMLVGTRGQQFSVPDLRRLLEGAGFRDLAVRRTSPSYSLVSAVKP